MEQRRLGRTGHMSTVAIFGTAAFYEIDQSTADSAMDLVVATGINHIDVAPSYGHAEKRLGPWVPRIRDRVFLACKTMERTREGAATELRRSLRRLHVDSFDLYQLHAINSQEELDHVTASGGALEAITEAQQKRLTRFIGITSHGLDAPAILLEALERFGFDTVMFPINFVLYVNSAYRLAAEQLLQVCVEREVGTMVIKSIAKGLWRDRPKTYTTWYEPFDEVEIIQQAVEFALSQSVTGLCTPADVSLLPLFLDACQHFSSMSPPQQDALIEQGLRYESIFE
jgi:aryl-alcohol dehydrogenase-like predicted oxidoreductase